MRSSSRAEQLLLYDCYLPCAPLGPQVTDWLTLSGRGGNNWVLKLNSWEKSHCLFSSCQVVILWNKILQWKNAELTSFLTFTFASNRIWDKNYLHFESLIISERRTKSHSWDHRRREVGSLTCHLYFECWEWSSAGPHTASCNLACWSDSSSPPWGCRPDPSARTWQNVISQ